MKSNKREKGNIIEGWEEDETREKQKERKEKKGRVEKGGSE